MVIDNEPAYFLSCDWGTSSFRLNLVDYHTGKVLKKITSSQGIGRIRRAQSDNPFQPYLASQIAAIEKKVSIDFVSIPIVISGMASSRIGWKELPYGTLPFSLDDPKLPVEQISPTEEFPHKVILVSGVRSTDDVMRGEETQVLGLANKYDVSDAICIFPGTHSKHIVIEDKMVKQFKTFMTGELFELISTQSILKSSVIPLKNIEHENAFQKGVEQALNSNLLHALFQIRVDDLLQQTDHKKNYDRLSGLLLGMELQELRQHNSKTIYLVGEGPLKHRYEMALKMLGIEAQSVKNASELTIEGHRFILNYFNQKPRNI